MGMRVDIVTLFPEMCQQVLDASIIGRAARRGCIETHCHQIRDYTLNKQKQTDDYPYGGGRGAVMQADPLYRCWSHIVETYGPGRTIFLSPCGPSFDQAKARQLQADYDNLILVCGHYEGVDQRAIDAVVDEELSLGDFVLTGGELAAMTVCDAVVRYVPGVLGSSDSTEEESFTGGLLEYPQYTRPRVFEGVETPEVLLNGDHAKIRAWRRQQSLLITAKVRPDLFETAPMSEKERQETLLLLQELQKEGENHAAP